MTNAETLEQEAEKIEAEAKLLKIKASKKMEMVDWLRKRIEKEKSPAGQWLKKYAIDNSIFKVCDGSFFVFQQSDMVRAHEAGQKHGAEAEREKIICAMDSIKHLMSGLFGPVRYSRDRISFSLGQIFGSLSDGIEAT